MTGAQAKIDVGLVGALGAFSLDVAFTAPMLGITGLFGPSGCGKTTILRCVAGLQRLGGRLTVGGEVWQDDTQGIFRKPFRRPVGYVFQEASLFPHLSVGRNLLFGARRAGGDEGPLRFSDVVDLLGIGHLLDRAPLALSGGERQRVAVGRALLSQPRLLLMDEPLSALDRFAKDDILPYFEALHASLSIPILYVSHDIAELERLADTLVLLNNGHVTACGPLSTLETDPSLPLMRAVEAAVTLEGRVAGFDPVYALTTLSVAGGSLTVAGRHGETGEPRRMRIKVSDVSFSGARPEQTTILNVLPVTVISVAPHANDAAHVNVVAGIGDDGGGARIVGRITRKSQQALALVPGSAVFAQIKSVALLATATGSALRARNGGAIA